MNKKLLPIVRQIIAMLIARNYQDLVTLTKGTRMSSKEIESAIKEYGKTISEPPSNAFDFMDVIQIRGAKASEFSVRMPLWTHEEGRSDLTLELTVKVSDEKAEVELDGIHVL